MSRLNLPPYPSANEAVTGFVRYGMLQRDRQIAQALREEIARLREAERHGGDYQSGLYADLLEPLAAEIDPDTKEG